MKILLGSVKLDNVALLLSSCSNRTNQLSLSKTFEFQVIIPTSCTLQLEHLFIFSEQSPMIKSLLY